MDVFTASFGETPGRRNLTVKGYIYQEILSLMRMGSTPVPNFDIRWVYTSMTSTINVNIAKIMASIA